MCTVHLQAIYEDILNQPTGEKLYMRRQRIDYEDKVEKTGD